MKRVYRNFDFLLLVAVTALVAFGVVMIGSATLKDGTTESTKQIVWFLMGLGLMAAAAFIDYHFICRFYILIYALCILLLVGVLLYGYLRGDDVKRWFLIGPAMLQPSEFTKLFLILFLSKFVTKFNAKLNKPPMIAAVLALSAVPVALIAVQPSLSASLVSLFISLSILFVGGLSGKLVVAGCVTVPPAAYLFLKDLSRPNPIFVDRIGFGYQLERIVTFLNPQEGSAEFFQTEKSIQAIASGQFSGKGLYNGLITQFSNLPEAHNDFIFSVIGEEFGFVGCTIVLTVILFIIFKCLLTAARAADLLGRLICVGVAAMFVFQTIVNVCVVTGNLPNTGMPLPFVSYGGSSMWINMTAVGLVINVGMTKPKTLFEG